MLQITEDVAAKVSLKSDGEHVRSEQTILELLNQVPCPYIVQTFLHRPDITFMELLSNGTLTERMDIVDKPRPVLRWMHQLSTAVARVESLGYAHGDLNPRNVLVNIDDGLKLIDFDHSLKIGEDLDVGDDPYVRVHRAGEPGSTYGVAGPITEQFALGSIFWYITRGTELYHDIEGHEVVNRLCDKQFPATNPEDPIDDVISRCWLGRFPSIADLVDHIQRVLALDQIDHIQGVVAFDPAYEARKKQCEQYYELLRSSSLQP